MERDTLHAAADATTTPLRLAELAAPALQCGVTHSNADVRVAAAVVANPSTADSTLASFLRLPHGDGGLGDVAAERLRRRGKLAPFLGDAAPSIRLDAAERPSTPLATLNCLAGDAEPFVRTAVATNAATPHGTLAELAGDADSYVADAAFSRMDADEETLLRLSARSETLLRRVISRVDCPVALLTSHATSGSEQVRRLVASHAATPPDVLDRVAADDPASSVRFSVAYNCATPASTVRFLSADRASDVRVAAGANRRCPEDALVRLANAGHPFTVSVAANPSTPAATLVVLSASRDVDVRRSAAVNPATPLGAQKALAKDPSREVRFELAASPSPRLVVLELLATDSDAAIRRDVAWRSDIPARLLKSLASDKDSSVRVAVAGNGVTPDRTIGALIYDDDPDVCYRANTERARRLVAEPPQRPPGPAL